MPDGGKWTLLHLFLVGQLINEIECGLHGLCPQGLRLWDPPGQFHYLRLERWGGGASCSSIICAPLMLPRKGLDLFLSKWNPLIMWSSQDVAKQKKVKSSTKVKLLRGNAWIDLCRTGDSGLSLESETGIWRANYLDIKLLHNEPTDQWLQIISCFICLGFVYEHCMHYIFVSRNQNLL